MRMHARLCPEGYFVLATRGVRIFVCMMYADADNGYGQIQNYHTHRISTRNMMIKKKNVAV